MPALFFSFFFLFLSLAIFLWRASWFDAESNRSNMRTTYSVELNTLDCLSIWDQDCGRIVALLCLSCVKDSLRCFAIFKFFDDFRRLFFTSKIQRMKLFDILLMKSPSFASDRGPSFIYKELFFDNHVDLVIANTLHGCRYVDVSSSANGCIQL